MVARQPPGGFHSHHYLTATRVSNWKTVRVYLGREWTRSKPERRATFSSGGIGKIVQTIEFPEADAFSYPLKDEETARVVRFDGPVRL